jgi:hypothetical protein
MTEARTAWSGADSRNRRTRGPHAADRVAPIPEGTIHKRAAVAHGETVERVITGLDTDVLNDKSGRCIDGGHRVACIHAGLGAGAHAAGVARRRTAGSVTLDGAGASIQEGRAQDDGAQQRQHTSYTCKHPTLLGCASIVQVCCLH